jgi:hypothetical protein
MTERNRNPPSSFFYAHEALGFVAYGNPAALGLPPPGQAEMRRKWGFEVQWNEGRNTFPLRQLRWVWARVRWRLKRAGRHAGRRLCPLPPLGSMDRAEVRRLLLRQGRPAFRLVADLRADMACAHTAAADHEERLYAADRALCAALANGEVRVFGRRGDALYRTAHQGQHEEVPSTYFLNELRGLMTSIGWATVRTTPDVPMDKWLRWCPSMKDPDWGDLRFPKADILARFPCRDLADTASASSTEPVTKAPKLADLSNRCSPLATASADSATGPSPGQHNSGAPLPVYSKRTLRAWYLLRVHAWPPDHPPPSEANDLAAAEAHFSHKIPRASFRGIRRELAPPAWKKPGPRGGRP